MNVIAYSILASLASLVALVPFLRCSKMLLLCALICSLVLAVSGRGFLHLAGGSRAANRLGL